MSGILIYCPTNNSRINYVLKLIFQTNLGLEYFTTNNIDEFENYQYAKLSYNSAKINDNLNIFNSGLLNNFDLYYPQDYKIFEKEIEHNNYDNYDYFALIFFLVSRIEEYNSTNLDQHERFNPQASFAYKNNFLKQPLVDVIIENLKTKLNKQYPYLAFSNQKAKTILTFDVDIAYKYKSRPLIRNIGACSKDILSLNFNNLFNRLLVLSNLKKDPFDTYSFIEEVAKTTDSNVFFFIQTRYYGIFDKAVCYKNPTFVKLLKRLSSFAEIGIHTSYSGGQTAEKISEEKQILEQIIDKEVTKSRQHYLRLLIPKTYNALIESGITEDYTMGYATNLGWRASTTKPFNVFDCNKNKELNIKTYPISFMDGTLLDYLKLNEQAAINEIYKILFETKKHNSVFIPLWHNDSISNHGIWKKSGKFVFNQMIELIKQKND